MFLFKYLNPISEVEYPSFFSSSIFLEIHMNKDFI